MCRLYHFAFDDQDTGRDLHSVNASGFYRPYTTRRRVARLAAKMSSVDWTNRLAMRGTSLLMQLDFTVFTAGGGDLCSDVGLSTTNFSRPRTNPEDNNTQGLLLKGGMRQIVS